jgi:hypothetical protein
MKDDGKWCEFHKIPWNNIDECCLKNSLVAELKENDPNPNSEYYLEHNKRKQIINAEPTATITTTKI